MYPIPSPTSFHLFPFLKPPDSTSPRPIGIHSIRTTGKLQKTSSRFLYQTSLNQDPWLTDYVLAEKVDILQLAGTGPEGVEGVSSVLCKRVEYLNPCVESQIIIYLGMGFSRPFEQQGNATWWPGGNRSK